MAASLGLVELLEVLVEQMVGKAEVTVGIEALEDYVVAFESRKVVKSDSRQVDFCSARHCMGSTGLLYDESMKVADLNKQPARTMLVHEVVEVRMVLAKDAQ